MNYLIPSTAQACSTGSVNIQLTETMVAYLISIWLAREGEGKNSYRDPDPNRLTS